MGQPIPAQHPSVVLRSHFNLVRTLLILAVAALLASSAAVVILANDEDQANSAAVSKSAPAAQQQLPAGTRFDGGPDEGTRGLAAQPQSPVTTRFDGGPEEGTRGARSYYDSPNQRSSYQPAPADSVKERVDGPRMMLIPQGPGAR
jgi:hypothetical protein